MTDILDLDGWTVIAKTTEEGCDVLDAEYRPQPTACLKCGVVGELYRHGTKPVTYLDSPIRGNPAKLRAKVQRYRCTACQETFLQPLGGISAERRMTERCATFIQSMCLRDTFVRIAEHLGCDDKAGLYDEKEARSICKYGHCIAVTKEVAQPLARTTPYYRRSDGTLNKLYDGGPHSVVPNSLQDWKVLLGSRLNGCGKADKPTPISQAKARAIYLTPAALTA